MIATRLTHVDLRGLGIGESPVETGSQPSRGRVPRGAIADSEAFGGSSPGGPRHSGERIRILADYTSPGARPWEMIADRIAPENRTGFYSASTTARASTWGVWGKRSKAWTPVSE